MNKQKIMRIGRYQRALDELIPMLTKGSKEDVQHCLDVMAARRSNNWKWSKDKEYMMDYSIPRSWFFRSRINHSRLGSFSGFGLETMDDQEKEAFAAAYRDRLKKLSS